MELMKQLERVRAAEDRFAQDLIEADYRQQQEEDWEAGEVGFSTSISDSRREKQSNATKGSAVS